MLGSRLAIIAHTRLKSFPVATVVFAGVLVTLSAAFLKSPEVTTALAVLLGLVLVLLTISPERAVLIAATAELLIAVLLPTFAVPGDLKVGVLTIGVGVAICALLRSGMSVSMHPNAALLILFLYLGFNSLMYFLNGRLSALPLYLLLALWAVLTVTLFRTLGKPGRRVLIRSASILMIASVVLAAGEMFAGLDPLWGFMGSGQDITARINNLAPAMPGRAVASFGHPILLGLFCSVTAYFACFSRPANFRPIVRLMIVLFAITGVVLSGSRSPLVAFVLAIVTAFLYKQAHTRITKMASIAVGLVSLLIFIWYFIIPELVSSETSLSFQHRLGVISSLPSIMERPWLENLIGSGPGASLNLFSTGTLAHDGMAVIDNQFILAFISTGIVGVSLLVLYLAVAFGTGSFFVKGLVVMTLVMMFSFDTTSWGIGLLLTVMCCGFTGKSSSTSSRTVHIESVAT